MAEIKKFITAKYLLNQLINFNSQILKGLYYKKEKGEQLETKVKDFLNEDNIESLVKRFSKSKIIIDTLPDANSKEADVDTFYIVKDKKAIDEKSPFSIYVLNNVNGIKKWVCASAPSYIFETEPIDFANAFGKIKNKYSLKESFICFASTIYTDTLENFLSDKPKITYMGSEYNGYNFLTNDFKKCCILYNDKSGIVYYFEDKNIENIDSFTTEPTRVYNVVDIQDLNTLANSIQNPNGELIYENR